MLLGWCRCKKIELVSFLPIHLILCGSWIDSSTQYCSYAQCIEYCNITVSTGHFRNDVPKVNSFVTFSFHHYRIHILFSFVLFFSWAVGKYFHLHLQNSNKTNVTENLMRLAPCARYFDSSRVEVETSCLWAHQSPQQQISKVNVVLSNLQQSVLRPMNP